jgi:hypothetical protein
MNYRELRLITIVAAIVAVIVLTAIYLPHARAVTTIYTSTTTYVTTTVTETNTTVIYTTTTTVTTTSTNTMPTTITSTVTGTEYLYESTTSVTFVASNFTFTAGTITQYFNTTILEYESTQTALYDMQYNFTIANTTYVVMTSTAYITMNRTVSLSGFYTVYVTPTVVATRTVSANVTDTTTVTVTNNVTQYTVFIKNLQKMDITFTVNGTATLTTTYVMKETVVAIGQVSRAISIVTSTLYVTLTNFYNITYIGGMVSTTMYISMSTTTVVVTKLTMLTTYNTSYIINGTVTVTSTIVPRIQGFTMNVSGVFLSAAFYISVGPQAYANVFYLNPSTVVALLGNYTPVNATMYVVYNGTTLATVTAGKVSTIYNASPNVTAYVTAPSYTGTFFVYDANQSPVSYLSDYEDLAYIAFVIGVGMLSNLFFRGNRLHAIIGMISVAILGGVVGYAFGIPLAYTSMATVVLVISAAILAIVERNRETMIGE